MRARGFLGIVVDRIAGRCQEMKVLPGHGIVNQETILVVQVSISLAGDHGEVDILPLVRGRGCGEAAPYLSCFGSF